MRQPDAFYDEDAYFHLRAILSQETTQRKMSSALDLTKIKLDFLIAVLEKILKQKIVLPSIGTRIAKLKTNAALALLRRKFGQMDRAMGKGGILTEPTQNQSSILKGKKILVVDDTEDNQMLESLFLTKAGAQVELASNGVEAVERALNGDHDIVLMDLHMPLLDGLSATAQLRKFGYAKPIIAVTADCQTVLKSQAFQMGFSDFMTKPLSRAELMHSLEKFLSNPYSEKFH